MPEAAEMTPVFLPPWSFRIWDLRISLKNARKNGTLSASAAAYAVMRRE